MVKATFTITTFFVSLALLRTATCLTAESTSARSVFPASSTLREYTNASMEPECQPFRPFQKEYPISESDLWLPFPPPLANPYQEFVGGLQETIHPPLGSKAVEDPASNAFKLMIVRHRPKGNTNSKIWDIHLQDHRPLADLNHFISTLYDCIFIQLTRAKPKNVFLLATPCLPYRHS